MTKKFLLFAVATALLAACNRGPKPEEIAQEFLNSYLATDYEKAASYCTPALSQDLLQALEEAEALNDEIKEKIKQHTPNYKAQINSIEITKSKDTVIIAYSIVNGTATDSLTAAKQIITSSLSVIKQPNGWKIGSLN